MWFYNKIRIHGRHGGLPLLVLILNFKSGTLKLFTPKFFLHLLTSAFAPATAYSLNAYRLFSCLSAFLPSDF